MTVIAGICIFVGGAVVGLLAAFIFVKNAAHGAIGKGLNW